MITFSCQRSILQLAVQLASNITTSSLFVITILTKLALKCGFRQVNECFRYFNFKADTHLRVETMFKDLQSRQQYKESWSSYASYNQRLLP